MIHIDVQTLRALTVKPLKKGKWQIQNAVYESLEQPSSEPFGEELKALTKIAKGNLPEAGFVLPRLHTVMRHADLPSAKADEIESMAQFEAMRHIPFNADRHIVDYHVTALKGVEGSEVLLGAVDQPYIEAMMSSVKHVNMEITRTTLSSAALYNAVLCSEPGSFAGKTVVLASIGLESLDLVIVSDGNLIYARAANTDLRSLLEVWSGRHLEDSDLPHLDTKSLSMTAKIMDCAKLDHLDGSPGSPPDQATQELSLNWIKRIIRELRQTLEFCRREMECPRIDEIMITGEGAAIKHLSDLIEAQMETSCRIFNPTGKCEVGKNVELPFDGLGFTIAYGALAAKTTKNAVLFNLTPQSYYDALEKKSIIQHAIVTGVLFIAAIGSGGYAYMKYMANARL